MRCQRGLIRAVWTTLDNSSQCQQRSTTPDLVPGDPPPAGRRPVTRNIPTGSDAEPAVAVDIAVNSFQFVIRAFRLFGKPRRNRPPSHRHAWR